MLLTVRQAIPADIPALQELIRASVLGLQAADYTPEQLELALERVFGVDTQLIEDGTYFVAEARVDHAQVIAGCGGWSKRKTLFGSDHCAGREDALLDPRARRGKDTSFLRTSFLGSPRSGQPHPRCLRGSRRSRRFPPSRNGSHPYRGAVVPCPGLRGKGTSAGSARTRSFSPHRSHGKAAIAVSFGPPFPGGLSRRCLLRVTRGE